MARNEPETSFPRVDALLAELRARTDRHGERGQLAQALGLSPNRLSEYLAEPPRRRPNGETALAMLAWLEADKRRT